MEPPAPNLRAMIHPKMAEGPSAVDTVPSMWSSVGHGEICVACDRPITELQMLMHGCAVEPDPRPLSFHVRCFYLWEEARGSLYL